MSCHENEILAEKLMDHYLALGYSEEEAEALTEKEMDRRVLISSIEKFFGGWWLPLRVLGCLCSLGRVAWLKK